MNVQCPLQWQKLPEFNAFPVIILWRQDSSVFPACRILIGQFKFQARQLYAKHVTNFVLCFSVAWFTWRLVHGWIQIWCDRRACVWWKEKLRLRERDKSRPRPRKSFKNNLLDRWVWTNSSPVHRYMQRSRTEALGSTVVSEETFYVTVVAWFALRPAAVSEECVMAF